MKKGFFFTIGIILLIIPLLLLIAFYTETSKTKTEDTIGKIRCDELYYFVEDVKVDMNRAMNIFGRRAAIYSIDYVVTNGVGLMNYSFNCTDKCGIDCNRFKFDVNGSEAAIAELTLCGTLYGENITYMANHTFREWINKINVRGEESHFRINMTPTKLTVVPTSAWNFAMILDNKLKASDEKDLCFYRETPIRLVSNTSIIGLEDPLYPLNTGGGYTRYIEDCDGITIDIDDIIGCGTSGGIGNATGKAVFTNATTPANFCSTTPDINEIILVFTTAYGNCKAFEDVCYNITSPYHLGGAINYQPGAFENKCDITIPWMKDTGDLSEDPEDRNDDCGTDAGEPETTTYDFNKIINPSSTHVARYDWNDSILEPATQFDSIGNEFDTNSYNSIYSSDNNRASTTSSLGNRSQHIFRFNVEIPDYAIDAGAIYNFTVTWEGYTIESAQNGSVMIWNWNSNNWEKIGNFSTSEETISKTYKTNIGYYINNNYLFLVAWNNGSILTDYVKLNITHSAHISPYNLSAGDPVWIKNNGDVHRVIKGISPDDINSTCYVISDVAKYNENCPMNYTNGPSFFDRLDGNYNLSEKYVNQSREYFNYTNIGIETIVNKYDLEYSGISVHRNATWVDYLYWENVNGSNICGVYKSGNYRFRLDCPHADLYGLTPGC